MPPSKSKKNTEESPEERRSKRRRNNEDEEEEEKEKDPISKGPPSKKAQLQSGGSSHKPAELFRKDLISAMKLADSEPLNSDDYILISDSWRQEWERGVQVPVNDISVPNLSIKKAEDEDRPPGDFKICSKKYLHSTKDEIYQLGIHELTGMVQLAEQVTRYDLDDLDVSWLNEVNEEREVVGLTAILEWTMERVIESLETQCHENMENKKKTEEGLGIEYDEDIVCEICQSPDSEDTNEMVFCDGCDICVHQASEIIYMREEKACYGITTVPEGSWLCRTCALGIKPQCILCPIIGGAMKSTRSGTKWSHVSCAIWVPEVTIACVEKMEPITKISQIPASRWALLCCVCKERCGACIQCSVKSCKTAFHVTCAFAEKLEMKTVLVEEKHSEDVKLKAYCPKHSRKRERNTSESETDSPRKSNPGTPLKEKEMTEEEKASLRADRLKVLDDDFYTLIQIPEIATQLQLEEEIIDKVFNYWKLKRKLLMYNRPLLTPKTEEADLLDKQQEDSLVARMKMFVHLRQDLERVRNLSYMITRREKMKKQFGIARESVFYATLEVLTDKHLNISKREVEKIVKEYKDIPAPYCSFPRKGKKFSTQAVTPAMKKSETLTEIVSITESASIKEECTNKARSHSPIELCVESESVSKSDTPISYVDKEASKTEKKTKKSEPKAKKALLQSTKKSKTVKRELEDGIPIDSEKEIKKEKKPSMDVDSNELVDIKNADDTIVNTSMPSQANSTGTVTQSENKPIKSTPNTQTLKKGKKKKLLNEKSELDKSLKDETDHVKKELVASEKTIKRSRGRPKKCLQTAEDGIKVESEADTPDVLSADKILSVETEKLATRERRLSSVVKISEDEKEKLVNTYPSAKNVSDQVKAELNGYFKSNKLVVSNSIKQKVQNALLNSKRRSRFSNGIIIDHSQKKIDNYLVKSPPPCDSNAIKTPARSMSRVLNELSPTRDRFEANNIERIRSSCVRLTDFQQKSPNTRSINSPVSVSREASPDRRSTRSNCSSPTILSVREKLFDGSHKRSRKSRESSPDSVKSYSSLRLERIENDKDRIRTRSLTPSGKDLFEPDFLDTENAFDSKRRKLRNQEGSQSPQSLLKSQTTS